jgi:two-component system, NtrC family, response regulator AtoC
LIKVDEFGPAEMELVKSPLHEQLLGTSQAIVEVNTLIQRLAKSDLTVLIAGESGTGKDIAARLLHKLSPRYGKPFIKVNCPAIPESILESELFGYERGAFTGARTSKPGRFELANHGTIFLDEIAETSYTVQSKLLQVLDGDPFMRIGGTTPVHADVRIIGATNINLEDAVQQGRMREDIFYRLSEIIVRMPALRERTEDIALLAEHFNYNFAKKLGKEYTPIPARLISEMQQLPWQGNIRELAARVKKYVATRSEKALLEDDHRGGVAMETVGTGALVSMDGTSSLVAQTSEENRQEAPPRESAHDSNGGGEPGKRKFMSLKDATRRAVETTERALIEEALKATLWNRRKAAKLLDISYSSLLRRIEAYNIGKTDVE